VRVAEQPTTQTTVGTAPANVSAAELTNQMTSLVGTVRTDLQTITDSTSAQAAIPKLQQASDQLDRLNRLASQLPPPAQKELAQSVSTAIPALNQLCDRILAIPGVAAVAKPTIDALRTKLDAINRA
jgi:phosphoglycerate-specific signal transduction histidine kinase